MLKLKRSHSHATIKECWVEKFEATMSFPPQKLPIKRQIIEQMLNFPDYRTLGAARNVAQKVHERWIWSLSCNVQPQDG